MEYSCERKILEKESQWYLQISLPANLFPLAYARKGSFFF